MNIVFRALDYLFTLLHQAVKDKCETTTVRQALFEFVSSTTITKVGTY